uniref:Uncharacterized protein n=1 Tax=Panagrolaimus superbus TaxID=310955 RepID=A0A914YPC1_9BILA
MVRRSESSNRARKTVRPTENSGGVARKRIREPSNEGSSRRKKTKPLKNNKAAENERSALQRIRLYGKGDFSIPRAPFFKVIKECLLNLSTGGRPKYKIQRAALDALQIFYVFGELKQVQIFSRHGQRAPTNFLIFPTDNPHFLDNFDAEPGELTVYGIRQEYELGLTLRKQYNLVLGDIYRSRESIFFAGKDNRTIVSALAVLAAIYPPKQKQIWMEGLNWQPIPVHTEELLDDVSFGLFDNCPTISKDIYQMADFKSMLEPLMDKVELLSNLSGIKIDNPRTFDKIIDSIKTRSLMPDLLPPPIWARNPRFLESIKNWSNLLHINLIDLINDKVGGWHFDLMIGKMEEIVRNQTNKKFILYSGHDTNIMAISRFLNLTTIAQRELQIYATYLSVELHQKSTNDFFVEFWLHPALNETRKYIGIPECPTPCSYTNFRKLRNRISTEEWHIKCKGIPRNLDDRCTLYASLAGGLVICVVILIAALLAAGWWCCHYRSKYNEIYVEDDDEDSPLLR